MFRRPRTLAKQLVRLHTTADKTFEGLLVASTRDHFALVGAKVEKGGALVDVVGNVYVPRERVLFMQTGYGAGEP